MDYTYSSGIRKHATLVGGDGGWIVKVPKDEQLTMLSDAKDIPKENSEKFDGFKAVFRDIGMATYNVADDLRSITLKPSWKNDGRTYTFVDANASGQCSADDLEALRDRLPGAMRVAADRKRTFKNLIMNIRAKMSDIQVRYQFFDCAKGLTPPRYQGLLCLAYQDQRGEASPTWEACGYVDEVASKRQS